MRGWGVRVRRVGVGVAVAVALVLLAPPALPDTLASRLAPRMAAACTEIDGADVELGAWPSVARLLVGRAGPLDARVDSAVIGGLAIRDVELSARRLGVPFLALFGRGDASITDARATARVDATDLTSFVRAVLPGATVSITREEVLLRPGLLGLGLGVGIELAVREGVLLLEPRIGSGRLDLPGVALTPPEGIRLDRVRAADGALTFFASVPGKLRLDEGACDQSATLRLVR